MPLLLAALGVVTVGAVLPFAPAGPRSGLPAPAGLFFLALAGIVACYLILIEIGRYWFYRWYRGPAGGG